MAKGRIRLTHERNDEGLLEFRPEPNHGRHGFIVIQLIPCGPKKRVRHRGLVRYHHESISPRGLELMHDLERSLVRAHKCRKYLGSAEQSAWLGGLRGIWEKDLPRVSPHHVLDLRHIFERCGQRDDLP